MITITREFGIDYGHRLVKHESKCRNVHGHRGRILVTVVAPALDAVGRVLDFGEVKTRIGDWLDRRWDHAFIAQNDDPLLEWLIAHEQKFAVLTKPPTAENLAAHLGEQVIPELLAGTECSCVAVEWFETPNCSAKWTAPVTIRQEMSA